MFLKSRENMERVTEKWSDSSILLCLLLNRLHTNCLSFNTIPIFSYRVKCYYDDTMKHWRKSIAIILLLWFFFYCSCTKRNWQKLNSLYVTIVTYFNNIYKIRYVASILGTIQFQFGVFILADHPWAIGSL